MTRSQLWTLATLTTLMTSGLTTASLAANTDSGNVSLTASVAAAVKVTVAGAGNYNALLLTTTYSDEHVANVNEKSNSRDGYTVTLKSANAGLLKNQYNGSVYNVTYTAKYGATGSESAANLTTAGVLVTNVATAQDTVTNSDKVLKISFTGVNELEYLEGNYTDTLTFDIAAL